MNHHLHSPTKLTEFARDFEDDEPETLFGRFVNKIQNAYNQSYNTVNDIRSGSRVQGNKSVFYADGKDETSGSISRDSSSSSLGSAAASLPSASASALPSGNNNGMEQISTSTTTGDDLSTTSEKAPDVSMEGTEGRTMVNVLKRISNIMATKDSDLRNYKDTDLQRFWMPDSKAKECYDCSLKFSTFRRKHHCRLCGQIFCSKCCNQVVPGKIIMCSGDLKVCNYCSKIVLSYLKSPNITVDLHSDLQALQQDLSSKLDDNNETSNVRSSPRHGTGQRKISVGYQEERFASHLSNNLSNADRKNILQQSNSLIALHEEMQRTLPMQSCGTDLIEFLNRHNKSSNKIQAVAILSAMLAAGFLQPIVPDSEQTDFDESLHYKFAELPRQELDTLNIMSVATGSNANSTDLSEANTPQFDNGQLPKSIATSLSSHSVALLDFDMENSIRSPSITSKLLESYCDHEEQMLAQMLRNAQLDLQWAKILTPLCCRAANHFQPEYCTNDLMDIRNYVNFKKLPGGKRVECTIVGGVVFSKNVAHKDMATRVERPRILLLQCPIMYERVEGKFVSISTVLLQENEYLGNVTARIMSYQPKVVLVHKNVAGIAQEMLRSKGITLVLDVKLSVMERLARTLQCDIVTSVESNIGKPKLGVCDAFYIKNFDDGNGTCKTLMFFEKLSNPRGYTCLLRGGNSKELTKVKKIASFLVYARYNWRLEMSFLLDEFVRPISPKVSIFDSKEQSPDDENANFSCADEAVIIVARKSFAECKPSDEKILTAITENVSDFTDPLRAAELGTSKVSPESSLIELSVATPFDNRFRTALSSTVLSISPFVTFPLPYLETEQGRKCLLRSFFPSELFYSKQWSHTSINDNNANNLHSEHSHHGDVEQLDENTTQMNAPHPFLTMKITAPIDNREIQTLLAEFRAFGGRYPKRKNMVKAIKRSFYHGPQKISDDHVYKDALDIENHQRLPVLFSSFYYNPKSGSSFCAPPTLLDMKFYGQQDIMLGQFLQRYCCRLTPICTLCDLPMLGHVRRYVHSMGCVQVSLSEDSSKTPPNVIYFTAMCSICNEITPNGPLSAISKCLSFAKYLELRFHGHAYKKLSLESDAEDVKLAFDGSGAAVNRCQHSLHRDYIHYFTYRNVVARFKYTPIDVWEIVLPPLVLSLLPPRPFDHSHYLEEIKNFSMKGHEVFTRIHERIADLASEDDSSPLLAGLKLTLSKDQFAFKQHIEIVQTILTEARANFYDISDAMLMAKRVLADSIEQWCPRLNEMAAAQKLAAKQPHEGGSGSHVADDGITCADDHLRCSHSDVSHSPGSIVESPRLPATQHIDGTTDVTDVADGCDVAATMPTPTPTLLAPSSRATEPMTVPSPLSAAFNASDKKSIKKMLIHLLPSTSHASHLQTPFVAQEHYTLPLGAFPILVHDHDLSSVIAYSLTHPDYQRHLNAMLNANSAGSGSDGGASMGGGAVMTANHSAAVAAAAVAAASALNPSPKPKRRSHECSHDSSEDNCKTASTAAAATIAPAVSTTTTTTTTATTTTTTTGHVGSGVSDDEKPKSKLSATHMELTFQDGSTQFTCKIYFAREFDLMRAHTLRPPKLARSLYKELEQSKKREELKVSQGKMGASGQKIEIVRKASDTDAATMDAIADGLRRDSGNNNDSSGNNNNNDNIGGGHNNNNSNNGPALHMEMEECRLFLARSLSSSVKWEARGGKSGSRFCKTLDDRFVLKEMSKGDISIFENFAPNYFEYINRCQKQQQPTLLAKIFGVFKITIKKKDFFQEKSLLVMENLFYGCDIKYKFDLKGSERNRLVNPTSQHGDEIVLLDENLMQLSWSEPLYILSHSKVILKDAINRDSSFLERNQVMDYSLLVGLDSRNGFLVLGIIDYIRTFTFDKKVESFVKQTGLLGGSGKLPTVISPERYKQRFTDSMDRYFYTVPDRWEALAKM